MTQTKNCPALPHVVENIVVSSAANVTVATSVLHSPSLRLCKARFSPFVVRHTFLLSKRARHIHTAGHVSSPRCSVRAARPNSWCPCPLCNPLKYSTRQKKTWYCGAQSLHKSSWTVELTIQELSFHTIEKGNPIFRLFFLRCFKADRWYVLSAAYGQYRLT